MIQALTVGRSALKWLAIWFVVTQLILGMIASYTWGQIAYNGYDWTFKVLKD